MKPLLAILTALFLLAAGTTASFAQDAAKKQMEHPAKAGEKMMKGKTEAGPLKTLSCGPDCGFSISTRDDKELVSVVQAHVKAHHNMEVTAEDVMKKATTHEGGKK